MTKKNNNTGLKIVMIIFAICLIVNVVCDITRTKSIRAIHERLLTLGERDIFNYEPYCEEEETVNYSVLMYNVTLLAKKHIDYYTMEYYDLKEQIFTETEYFYELDNDVLFRVNNVFYGQETKSTGRCKRYGLYNKYGLIFRLT